MPTSFSDEQRQAFHEDGFVRLPGALPAAEVDAMRARLWHQLARNGALPDDPGSWEPRAASHLQRVRRGDPDPRENPVLEAALDALMSPGDPGVRNWGQALVTFPSPGPWTVPHRVWHLDYPYGLPADRILGGNLFLMIDPVRPRGGATLAVRGSPTLIRRFVAGLRGGVGQRSMKQLRHAFEQHHPWFRALSSPRDREDRVARFVERSSEVDGVTVQVVELTGEPGDVYVCHPWLVHNGSPNVLDRPRLMRVARVRLRPERRAEKLSPVREPAPGATL